MGGSENPPGCNGLGYVASIVGGTENADNLVPRNKMDEMVAILILIVCGEDSSYRTVGILTMTKLFEL
jgi:hypothetical protein